MKRPVCYPSCWHLGGRKDGRKAKTIEEGCVIVTTMEGLLFRRKEAERFSMTAKSAEAREWWRREAREANLEIERRKHWDAINN